MRGSHVGIRDRLVGQGHKLKALVWHQRGRQWSSPLPRWLLFVCGTAVGGVPALLINVAEEALDPVLALLGVFLGGAIAAATSFVTAQLPSPTRGEAQEGGVLPSYREACG
jgi:hypothetical protein